MIEPVTINLRFLSRDIGLPQEQVQAVVELLDAGHPVPFIARYRKDQTGNLDEDGLRRVESQLNTVRSLCERKQAILRSLDSLGKLTPELEKKIRDAKSAKRLEDLYLPFKPKKQTLASTARQRGLEPLASEILSGALTPEKIDQRAAEFIDEDKKIRSVADALLGAGHLIAESFAERFEVLQQTREFLRRNGKLVSSKIERKAETDEKPKPEIVSEPPDVGTEISDAIEESAPEGRDAPENPIAAANESPGTDDASDEPSPVSDDARTAATDETVVMRAVAVSPVDSEPTESEDVSSEPPLDDLPVETVSDAVPEPTGESSAMPPPEPDVQAVTEQFKQWKEAQEEQGAPTVVSAKTLRKKRKAEIRKKKAEAKVRQQEQLERQFSDYFQFSSGVHHLPPHRILAINRGERAGILRAKVECDEERVRAACRDECIPKEHPLADFLEGCLKDALHRLVVPMMERELRDELTANAEAHSTDVFAKNLRKLLLQPPLHRKRVLAVDPGIRYGCKMVPLDEFGNVLGYETAYLTGSAERKQKALRKIVEIIKKYGITVIAIGNGTGSREAEESVSEMIATHFAGADLAYAVVNEAGASVYSAGPIAKEEFPDYDVLVRGAVSIGRRLQDPLNELVKIDPASLGVGMYQHDVKAKYLRETLTQVVASCVNHVGIDLNSATPAILRYVAGLNQLTAKRIHEYRRQNGPFRSREDLKKVSGLGDVAFTHAAGFLKIREGSQPLDATWIHPESYELAGKILEKLGFAVDDLRDREKTASLASKIRETKLDELASRLSEELQAGLYTVRDVLDNLLRPGRDPRESLPKPIFKKGVLHLEDLSPGMELKGTVLNVVDFGAFVDIGLHDSGLIHISQMADRYIRDAHEKVAVGDIVRVWVVEVDPARKRISLTMLPPGTEKRPRFEHRRDGPKRDDEHREPDRAGDRSRSEGRQQDRPQGSGDKRPRQDRPPRQEGDRSRRGSERDRRDDRGKREHRDDRRGRDRSPKSFDVRPKDKTIKPITEEMKQGKEPLRSFGDLAQLLGRVPVPDSEAEKKRKKEEERKRRERDKQAKTDAPPDTGESPESV